MMALLTSRVRPLAAPAVWATVLVALSGCADLGLGAGSPWDASRYPSDRRQPTYDTGGDDYRRSSEYRRVAADAAEYARYVDRHLRLDGGHEAAIREITERRAMDLLRRTSARDHARVYPFPRQQGRNTSFWNGVDGEVERRLGSRYRDDYRSLVRYGQVRDSRTDDRRTERGRDDGERGRPGARRGRDDRQDDDDRDRRRSDRDDNDDDRAQRRGESLEDWYRRQARRPR